MTMMKRAAGKDPKMKNPTEYKQPLSEDQIADLKSKIREQLFRKMHERVIDKLKKNPGLVPVVADLFIDYDPHVRVSAIIALVHVAVEGVGNEAMEALGKASSEGDQDFNKNLAWALSNEGKKGLDISAVLPILLKAFQGSGEEFQGYAYDALKIALASEKSRDAAVGAILKALGDPDDDVQFNSEEALADFAMKDPEMRVFATNKINAYLRSELFGADMLMNSRAFERTIQAISRFLAKINDKENAP